MKVYSAVLTLPCLVTGGYNVGGFDVSSIRRPLFVSARRGGAGIASSRGCRGANCSPEDVAKRHQKRQAFIDSAFDDLKADLDSDRSRGRRGNRNDNDDEMWKSREFKMDEESIREKKEWVDRAFGFAADVASDFATSPREVKESNEALRQQQEWVNRIFGVVTDLAAGRDPAATARSEILQDDKEAFQVELDVPGIKPSNLDIVVEGDHVKTLIVVGERALAGTDVEGVSRMKKFSKSFILDSTTETSNITATLDNGVLTITAPKDSEKLQETVQTIPVVAVSDDDESTQTGNEGDDRISSRFDIDVPGVKAANIEVTVEGEHKKILKILAERAVGKNDDGSPRTKMISRSIYLDSFTDMDNITATLNNGVLTVKAPKDQKKLEEKIQRIPVTQRSDDTKSVGVDLEDAGGA